MRSRENVNPAGDCGQPEANLSELLPSERPSRRQYGPVGMTANGGGTSPRAGITPAGSLLYRVESVTGPIRGRAPNLDSAWVSLASPATPPGRRTWQHRPGPHHPGCRTPRRGLPRCGEQGGAQRLRGQVQTCSSGRPGKWGTRAGHRRLIPRRPIQNAAHSVPPRGRSRDGRASHLARSAGAARAGPASPIARERRRGPGGALPDAPVAERETSHQLQPEVLPRFAIR